MFRQVIGIPMGTDCAPFLANLFLLYYEFEFMDKMAKGKNPDIYRFRRIARYLDDLLIVNGGDVMGQYVPDIYPPELILKWENPDNDQTCTFLDLSMNLVNGKIVHKLYDKRDDFPFEIVNYPNLSGNICVANAFGVLIGQLLRIAKACQQYDDFRERSCCLIHKLVKQQFPTRGFVSRLIKFYNRHFQEINKYGVDLDTFVKDLNPSD